MEFIGRTKVQTAFFLIVAGLFWLGLHAAVCLAADAASDKTAAPDPNCPAVSFHDPNGPAVTIPDPNAPVVQSNDPNCPAKPIITPGNSKHSTADTTSKSDIVIASVSPSKPSAAPTAKPEISEATIEDPNTPATSASDPNDLDNEDEADVFSPKISTLVKINQGFESIFSPDFVTDNGLVHYAELRRKRSDLLSVIRELDNLNPIILMSLSPREKTAFWINTHNTCVLFLIIDNYPIKHKPYMIFYPNNSIMQITGDWRTKHLFAIQGFQYELEEIEKVFLLDRTQDPRILFALHYASLGGGLLRNEPYTAEKLDEQLDEQVKRFLATDHGLKLDKGKNTLYLSNLFSMYKHKDFFESSEFAKIKRYRDRGKPAEQAWLNFIHDYLEPADLQYLKTSDFDIKFIKYDWELNEAP